MNIEQARFNMIEQQIRPWNVGDASVLDTLAAVKREDFVPAAHKSLAFADLEVALPGGQAMLTPSVEARLLQDLAVKPHETVLEIGTGSGYMAAILARNALRVVTLEIVPELVALARSNLQKAGIQNVEVREADGTQVAAVQGSYDVIVLSGSVAEIPQTLLNLLKVGGRLAAIVGDEPMMRATVVTRTGSTAFTTVQAWDTVAPRLRNFPQPECFEL
jgi:protein-L-isoaspartate(D-aspartate) O-methyltransferase